MYAVSKDHAYVSLHNRAYTATYTDSLLPSFHPDVSLEENNIVTHNTGYRHETTTTNFVVKQEVLMLSLLSSPLSL